VREKINFERRKKQDWRNKSRHGGEQDLEAAVPPPPSRGALGGMLSSVASLLRLGRKNAASSQVDFPNDDSSGTHSDFSVIETELGSATTTTTARAPPPSFEGQTFSSYNRDGPQNWQQFELPVCNGLCTSSTIAEPFFITRSELVLNGSPLSSMQNNNMTVNNVMNSFVRFNEALNIGKLMSGHGKKKLKILLLHRGSPRRH
jgi:hypothetical protein